MIGYEICIDWIECTCMIQYWTSIVNYTLGTSLLKYFKFFQTFLFLTTWKLAGGVPNMATTYVYNLA